MCGFNQGANAFHLGKRDHIYYGSVSKIARFHPDSLFEEKTPQKMVLTNLTINYKKATITAKGVLDKAITYKKSITLSHKDNNLSPAFAKLESGNMTLQAGEIDIVQFIKRLVASFMSLAERKNITLKFTSSDKAVLCYVDADKFEKIINNVLSNAFKFTPVGGRVMVSLIFKYLTPVRA